MKKQEWIKKHEDKLNQIGTSFLFGIIFFTLLAYLGMQMYRAGYITKEAEYTATSFDIAKANFASGVSVGKAVQLQADRIEFEAYVEEAMGNKVVPE